MNPEIQEATFREILIPGDVLDDDNLSDSAKIIYGKISRLSFKTGYCWGSNSFLDGTKTGRNASRAIAELKKYGYILIEHEKGKNRKIWISKVKSKITEEPAIPTQKLTSPEMAMLEDQPRQMWQDNLAKNGELTSPNLATEHLNITTKITTTTSPTPIPDDPLPTVAEITQEEAEEPIFTTKELKQYILSLDYKFFLDPQFYTKAINFMQKYNLDYDYVKFIYKQCEIQNPRSYKGYFFSIFFYEHFVEDYLARRKKSRENAKKNIETNWIICPACGNYHSKNDVECPYCRLPDTHTSSEIELYKKLYDLPPDIRDEYLTKEKEIIFEMSELKFSPDYADIFELKKNNLKKEFGLTA